MDFNLLLLFTIRVKDDDSRYLKQVNEHEVSMTVDDFRRIALSLEDAKESAHMGQPDFRVGGRIFATLASADQGYGNLMLTPERRGASCRNCPRFFSPLQVDGDGWG